MSHVMTLNAVAMAKMPSVALSDAELVRYHRQINLKGWDLGGQERLKVARVLIIGLGGSVVRLASILRLLAWAA